MSEIFECPYCEQEIEIEIGDLSFGNGNEAITECYKCDKPITIYADWDFQIGKSDENQS